MKIYSLEFISLADKMGERIWHTNRRALERYARTLRGSSFEVHGIKAFEVTMPMTESRLAAFLNMHCADYAPPQRSPDKRSCPGRSAGAGSKPL